MVALQCCISFYDTAKWISYVHASPFFGFPSHLGCQRALSRVSHSSVSDSFRVHGLQPTRLLCPWDSPGKNGLPCPAPGVFPNSGVGLKSPTSQVASLPSEALGEPKSTGVGSLSFLQQIFPSQELNQGLLHCRQILYQLSYQRSPIYSMHSINTYICQPQFPNSPHLFLSPLVSMHLISTSMSVFLLYK